MRKLALIVAVALLPAVAGCARLQAIVQAGQFATASVTNPVTPAMLAEVENGMIIAFAGLNAYKASCRKGAADVNCRENIKAIQAYTRRLPPLVTQVRIFVRNNDKVNAVVAYNQIVALIANFKSAAVAAGVPIGG